MNSGGIDFIFNFNNTIRVKKIILVAYRNNKPISQDSHRMLLGNLAALFSKTQLKLNSIISMPT